MTSVALGQSRSFEVVAFASAWHARFGPSTCFAPENWDLPAGAGAHGHDGNVGRSSHKRLQGQNPHELLGGSLSLLVLVCFAVSGCQITFGNVETRCSWQLLASWIFIVSSRNVPARPNMVQVRVSLIFFTVAHWLYEVAGEVRPKSPTQRSWVQNTPPNHEHWNDRT